MSTPDLTAIPLPAEPSSAVAGKKPAEDMSQGALKNHSVILGKEPAAASEAPPNKVLHSSASTITAEAPPNKVHHSSASTITSEAPPNKVHHSSASTITSEVPPNKVHHSSASTITAAGLDGKESSQRIVDQLFKDFIAQKITSTSRGSKDDKTVSRVRNSADEISKLLDMEIKSIKSSTESKDKLHDRKDQRSNSVSKQSKFIPVSGSAKEDKRICDNVLASSSGTPSLSSRNKRSVSSSENKVDAAKSQSTANDNTHVVMTMVAAAVSTVTVETVSPTTTASESTTQSDDPLQPPVGGSSCNVKRNMMLPVSLAKKMMQPKVLGMKLSTESLSLIQSKDRIDRDGRVWEEGEVCSTGTEGSEKDKTSDSDGDGVPSESGSIHSNSGELKSQGSKHKRKHKHRHKKKRKKKSSKEKDVDRDSRRSKDTHDKDQEKCSTRGKSDKDTGSSKDRDTRSSQDRETRSSQDRETRSSKDRETRSSKDRETRSSQDRETRSSKDRDDQKVEKDQIIKEDSEKHSGKVKHRSSDHAQRDLKRKEKDSKKRDISGSSSRSPKRRRKSKSRSRSRSKSPKRHRSRSSSPKSHGSGRYGEWDARRYSDDHSRFRSRSGSRSKDRHRRSRDRSKSHERDRSKESNDKDLRVKIDKAKLRKIAIANALQNMKAGQGPQVDLTLAKSGGKSVEELTEFCKRISEKSKVAEANDDSSDGETANKSDDEDTLIHHPFKVKEASSTGIVMNIRNAKQLPVLTPSEKQAQQAALRLTFPVSSGSIHRASESEWVPVVKPGPSAPVPPPAPAAQVATVAEPPVTQKSGDSIFPDVSEAQTIDIGAIISERLQAVRKLQENPYDMQALSQMHQVQQQASKWAASRHLPGQFVGSTGAQVLTQEQLIGDRRRQAWAKKTQLSHAAPVHGGIGMFLLQKMGWKQGEGLGKNNEGSREPLMLDIKVDRRGLTTAAENPRHRPPAPAAAPRAKDLSNKHPVSALMELCNRRKWGPPMFTVVSESGPDHKKNFLFKVRVNNVEYQSASPSSNKKTAKALCAAICLQEMGLLPRDAPLNI